MLRKQKSARELDDKQPVAAIISGDTPPISSAKCSLVMQAVDRDAHEKAILAIYNEHHQDKPAKEISIAYELLFYDHHQALLDIKKDALANVQSATASFIQNVSAHDEDNPLISMFTQSVCRSLEKNLSAQNKGIDTTIQAEMNAIASVELCGMIPKSIREFLQTKYDILSIYKSYAAALYNAAADYYRDRWQASHHDATKLKIECDAFNNIFGDIVTIQPDYTLTSPEATIKFLANKTIDDIEKYSSELLKRAQQNKLDDKKSSLGILINALNNFNNIEKYPLGEYFTPLNPDDKKLLLTFHDNVHVKFQAYLVAKQKYESITPEQLESALDRLGQLKPRVPEIINNFADGLANDLAAAQDIIASYRYFIQEEDGLEDAILNLNRQMSGLHRRLETLHLPLKNLDAMRIDDMLKDAYRALFNNDHSAQQYQTLAQSGRLIQDQIDQQRAIIRDLKTKFQKTVTSLKAVPSDLAIKNVKSNCEQIRRQIEAHENEIIAAEQNHDDAINFFRQIQSTHHACNDALQYNQDLLNGNQVADEYLTDIGKLRPFQRALNLLSTVQRHRLYEILPPSLQQYIESASVRNALEMKNAAAILCCHLILGCALNFEYWQSVRDQNINIQFNNNPYSIPHAIIKLIELARQPEHLNWFRDPAAAKQLLAAMQSLSANTKCSAIPMKQFFTVAANPDHIAILCNREHSIPAKMLMQPTLLLNPAKIDRVQHEQSFWDKHPRAKKYLPNILRGAAIALAICTIAAIVVFPVLYALDILSGVASFVGGTAVLAGIATAATAIFTSIGAGIGALFTKLKHRRNPAPAQQHRRPPPPAHLPRELLHNNAAPLHGHINDPILHADVIPQVSMARSALFAPPAALQPPAAINHKNDFEQMVLEMIIERYCGKSNEANQNRLLRSKIIKLWADSNKSMDTFLAGITKSHPASADNVIESAVLVAAKEYPDIKVLDVFPKESKLRAYYIDAVRKESLKQQDASSRRSPRNI